MSALVEHGVRWPRLGLWLNYPLSKAAAFMAANTPFSIHGHVIVIGPLALIVAWKRGPKP